jgi:glyoxylase-like metal-dependent hydrolase (beta-lactamase superfamily II)/rhodanese-related sulfurtransferase
VIFRQLFDPASSTYTYLLGSASSGEALLIDPVLERTDQYLRLLHELDLELVKAVDTHLHADHVTALAALRALTRCVTIMGEKSRVDVVSMRVGEGDAIEIDGLRLDVLYTPGHTDDSYSFAMADRVFTGDTLLIRGTGRTDFQNGDAHAAYQSLFGKLLALPDETLVFPAHDYRGATVSTIGEERAHNPRLQVGSAEEYAELMSSLRLASPEKMDVAVPANLRIGADQGAGSDWAVSPGEAMAWVGRPDVLFVDLREDRERAREGEIPGSLQARYRDLQALLAPAGLLRHAAQARSTPADAGCAARGCLLFYCAFGERSALAVATAREHGVQSVRHVVGGLDAWRRAGGPIAASRSGGSEASSRSRRLQRGSPTAGDTP